MVTNFSYSTVNNRPIKQNTWWLFALVLSIGLLLVAASQSSLISDELYFNSFAEQLSFEQIQTLIQQSQKWAWLGYVFLPVYNLVKFSAIAGFICLAFYLSRGRILFQPFLNAVIKAELVLLIPGIIKLLWFLFIQTDYTLQDLQFFYPLSALSLFDYEQVEPWLLYPLQVLNVFELLYWFALAYGITRVLPEYDLGRAMSLVLSSYGVGLLVWVAAVMFLTLSYS